MDIILGFVCLVVICFLVYCLIAYLEKLYLDKVKFPRMVRECAAKKEAERLAANSDLEPPEEPNHHVIRQPKSRR